MELVLTLDQKGLDADKLVTGRTCIIGQSGSGKSYAVAVLCEELAKNNIGFCIIDTEGEYFSLKEKYTLLWAGMDSNSDINLSETDLDKLAARCLREGFPLILDVSEIDNPKETVAKFCSSLYKYGTALRKPYLLIVEEIDKFVPQTGERIKEIEEIARRGRKRGLGLMIATQRPAFVNKNILSQCSIQLIGRLTIPNDITAVRFFFSNKNNLNRLPALQAGEFFLMGEISDNRLVKIRQRETTHKAVTPKLKERKETKFEIEKFKSSLSEETVSEEKEETVNTIPAMLSQSDALEKAKRAATKFFVIKPQVLSSKLLLRPLYLLKIRESRKQIIGSKFVEFYVMVDAVSGKVVSSERGYSVSMDVSELLGLSQQEIILLNLLKKDISVSELCAKTGYSESTVRTILAGLEDKKLISNKKVGRVNLYVIFSKIKIPKLSAIGSAKPSHEKSKVKAELMEPKVSYKNFENLFKALGGIVVEKMEMYYPVYSITCLSNKKQEKIFVDGVNGKTIMF